MGFVFIKYCNIFTNTLFSIIITDNGLLNINSLYRADGTKLQKIIVARFFVFMKQEFPDISNKNPVSFYQKQALRFPILSKTESHSNNPKHKYADKVPP